ncbi:MAG: hypothetical protein JNM43_12370 [Planctomycetaceae bacterium]|nr:hypothetical protein [Planctomycetaceae bacterium]
MNSATETSANPYVPDNTVGQAPAAGQPSFIATKLRKRPWITWCLPVSALALWMLCYQYSSTIMFWLYEVPNIKNPGYDSFIAMVTWASAGLWALGGAHQVLMLAFRKQIPGSLKHLLPGLLLSATCAGSFLMSRVETTKDIEEYPHMRRGPVRERFEPQTDSPSPSAPAP